MHPPRAPTGAAKCVKRSSLADVDNQTQTTTGDKRHYGGRAAGAGTVDVIRRSASSKRNCEFYLELSLSGGRAKNMSTPPRGFS